MRVFAYVLHVALANHTIRKASIFPNVILPIFFDFNISKKAESVSILTADITLDTIYIAPTFGRYVTRTKFYLAGFISVMSRVMISLSE